MSFSLIGPSLAQTAGDCGLWRDKLQAFKCSTKRWYACKMPGNFTNLNIQTNCFYNSISFNLLYVSIYMYYRVYFVNMDYTDYVCTETYFATITTYW